MYRIIVSRDPHDPLLSLLSTAFLKAKKMGNKLRQYNEGYDEDWWELHKLGGGELDSVTEENRAS